MSSVTPAVGQSVAVTQVVSNVGSRDVEIADEGCNGPGRVQVALAVPTTPAGATLAGQQAQFKEYMLTNARNGDLPYTAPYRTSFGPRQCGSQKFVSLAPGHQLTATRSSPLEQVPGILLGAGSATIVVTVAYFSADQIATPSPTAAGASPGRHMLVAPDDLETKVPVTVVGAARHILSAGQAVDAALTSSDFAAFVEANPATTWGNANLYLDDGWNVEIFTKDEASAIVRLDPSTGRITWHGVCGPADCRP